MTITPRLAPVAAVAIGALVFLAGCTSTPAANPTASSSTTSTPTPSASAYTPITKPGTVEAPKDQNEAWQGASATVKDFIAVQYEIQHDTGANPDRIDKYAIGTARDSVHSVAGSSPSRRSPSTAPRSGPPTRPLLPTVHSLTTTASRSPTARSTSSDASTPPIRSPRRLTARSPEVRDGALPRPVQDAVHPRRQGVGSRGRQKPHGSGGAIMLTRTRNRVTAILLAFGVALSVFSASPAFADGSGGCSTDPFSPVCSVGVGVPGTGGGGGSGGSAPAPAPGGDDGAPADFTPGPQTCSYDGKDVPCQSGDGWWSDNGNCTGYVKLSDPQPAPRRGSPPRPAPGTPAPAREPTPAAAATATAAPSGPTRRPPASTPTRQHRPRPPREDVRARGHRHRHGTGGEDAH